ncbi:conserved hypothetical protein [Escherichia coli]|nr:conserved hypothetical protein [Escherichia coli]
MKKLEFLATLTSFKNQMMTP